MTTLLAALENGLAILWRTSWQASVLAILVFAVTLIVRLPARVRCILWMLVLLRLVLPVLPQSRWSVFNMLGAAVPASTIQPAPMAFSPTERLNGLPSAEPAIEAHWSSGAKNQASARPVGESTRTMIATGASPGTNLAWWQIVTVLWAAGAVLMLGTTVVASLRLRSMLKNFRPIHDPALQSLLAGCAQELAIRRQIPLCVSNSLESPALVGLWRPRLVLPAALCGEFSAAELRLVFLHELTHYKCCDIPLNYLLALLRAAHWFNPVLHLFFNRWHSDRELACDEAVMARLEDPRSYGQTILKLLQALAGPRRATMPGVVGILESKSLMKRRIAMIASFRPRSRWMAVGCGVLLTGVGCVAMTDAVSQAADNGQQAQKKTANSTVTEARMTATNSQAKNREDAAHVLAQAGAATNAPRSNRNAVPKPTSTETPASDASIQSALNTPLSYDNAGPLNTALEYLADRLDINTVVDWPALSNAGVERDAKIQLRITKPIAARKLLELILRQASSEIGYSVDNGVLEIGTHEIMDRQSTMHVYDVSSLLEAKADGKAATTGADLVRLIETTVARDTWHVNGGSVGDASIFNGKLIVKTTPGIHQEVLDLLNMLHDENKSK